MTFFCLSGGYPYFLRILFTMTHNFAFALSFIVQSERGAYYEDVRPGRDALDFLPYPGFCFETNLRDSSIQCSGEQVCIQRALRQIVAGRSIR